MKDMMVGIAGLFGKRCTKKQKDRFILYMQNRAQETKDKFILDDSAIGHRICRNLYIGNLKKSKILLTIPYDTATKILWPGIHYYPVNAKKNAIRDSIARALDLLAAIALAGVYYIVVFQRFFYAQGLNKLFLIFGMLLVTALAVKIVYGFCNCNNYVRNSASIAVALECLKQFEKDSIAVALLDYSCSGFTGYKQLADYLKRKNLNKKIIALDCLTCGEELHLHYLETKWNVPEGVQVHQIFGDTKRQSVIGLFSDIAILTGGSYVNEQTVVCGTRCNKDNQIELKKMEWAVDVIRELAIEQATDIT